MGEEEIELTIEVLRRRLLKIQDTPESLLNYEMLKADLIECRDDLFDLANDFRTFQENSSAELKRLEAESRLSFELIQDLQHNQEYLLNIVGREE